MKELQDFQSGDVVEIIDIIGDDRTTRRIRELGLFEGRKVEIIIIENKRCLFRIGDSKLAVGLNHTFKINAKKVENE